MPIHCACINPACGKTILEMMLAPLGPAAEDLCKDSEQRTLVHYAAVCESEQPLEVLLTTGFSPHRASNQGITPLMCACLANRPKNVARLLSAKADPLARANERTSFHWSVQNGCFEALDALVKHMATLAAEMPPPVKGKKGGKKPKPSSLEHSSPLNSTVFSFAWKYMRLFLCPELRIKTQYTSTRTNSY